MFQENSSALANTITASGTDCETARAVASDARYLSGAPYESHGFSCPRTPPEGLSHYYSYKCVNGDAYVFFRSTR